MKTGLIMEGGAMRGMFTAGVTDVMMENGITFDGAIGVSAGAVFGCNYKSHQIGRSIRYNEKYCKDPRYVSIRSWLKTGDVYGVEFGYHKLVDELDPFDAETFRNSPMEFYVVCTDVMTGKAVYHRCERGDHEDLEWMRASASMPLASTMVRRDDLLLSDGGTADSIPIRYFENIGYDRNVIILTQPQGFVKKPNKMMPLLRITLRKYPTLLQALEKRPAMYNDTIRYITEGEKNGKFLVIRPAQALQIGPVEHDPKELERVYQSGREAGMQSLGKVKEWQSI